MSYRRRATRKEEIPRADAGLIASCGLAFFVIPLSGYLSDRIGRKRMYIIGAVAIGVFGFVYFVF